MAIGGTAIVHFVKKKKTLLLAFSATSVKVSLHKSYTYNAKVTFSREYLHLECISEACFEGNWPEAHCGLHL